MFPFHSILYFYWVFSEKYFRLYINNEFEIRSQIFEIVFYSFHFLSLRPKRVLSGVFVHSAIRTQHSRTKNYFNNTNKICKQICVIVCLKDSFSFLWNATHSFSYFIAPKNLPNWNSWHLAKTYRISISMNTNNCKMMQQKHFIFWIIF